jgi:hypothetical protein
MAVNNLNTGVGIQPTIVDAKGDLIAATANDAVNRLAVGTNGQVLVAASGETTGLKWNDPGTVGGLVHINTTTFSSVASESFNDVFSATYDNYYVLLNISASTAATITLRLRNAGTDLSGSVYNFQSGTLSGTTGTFARSASQTSFTLANSRTLNKTLKFLIGDPFNSKYTNIFSEQTDYESSVTTQPAINFRWGNINNELSYSGFSILISSGNISGQVAIYGYRK